jgi:tetratricopeptide (TPR) repeat protein
LYEQGFEKGKRRLFREAIIDFDQAIRRDPNFVEAYVARGYAQVLIDEKESAVKDFRMAEKIYSKRKEISLSIQYRELRENLQKEIRK